VSELSETTPDEGTSRDFSAYLVVVGMAAVMWIVEVIDLIPGVNLDQWGIEPRQLSGLIGVVTAPFLHAGFGHLIGNTLPFLVLGCLVAAGGLQRFLQVTVIVGLCSGLGTWLLGGANSNHIGASGLVFGYLTYLIMRGIFARQVGLILIGVVVVFFYGGILWGLLPQQGISWSGHIFGAAGGVLAAWTIHRRREEAD
jgi:membrane associated rhomboid family serine protease